MEITNVDVYDLAKSIKASGYPKSLSKTRILDKDDLNRADKLAKVPSGSGHDCFLKGIVVNFDVKAPQFWWLQFGRYSFSDIVSSQSKTHMITEMDIDKQCNKYVRSEIIEQLNILIERYNYVMESTEKVMKQKRVMYDRLMSNVPMGLELEARITTNYLQLKTIYNQRKHHISQQWREFCEWIDELPKSDYITGGDGE